MSEFRLMLQLPREITHENVVKLVNVHINHMDMSLYLAFDYAEHDLFVSIYNRETVDMALYLGTRVQVEIKVVCFRSSSKCFPR